MKSKLDKHIEAGTVDAYKARQAASRASTIAYHQRRLDEAKALALLPTAEAREAALRDRVETLERQVQALMKLAHSHTYAPLA